MKLKTILLLNENTSNWDGITEGNGWFCYRESNNWDSKRAGASVYITEGEPHKYWIKMKTHGLRKPTDTNESYRERVRKNTAKVSRSWMSAARKLKNNPEINEVGNEIQMTWKQAFREALNDPRVSAYIAEWGEDSNIKKKYKTTTADAVNFSFVAESVVGKRTWSAVVLDGDSKTKLISHFKNVIPKDWEIIAHHQTIDPFGSTDDEGSVVTLKVTHVGKSDMAFAVKVSGYSKKTNNAFPHVTVAVNKNEGGKAKHSNDITHWEEVSDDIQLYGIVKNIS